MSRRFQSAVVRLLFIGALLASAVLSLGASTGSDGETSATRAVWTTYEDPRFDFSVEYPADWEVTPRIDRPGYVGGSLVLQEPQPTDPDHPRRQRVKVDISFYLAEHQPPVSLADWLQEYHRGQSVLALGETRIVRAYPTTAAGREAVREDCVSSLGDYSSISFAHGSVVWYISASGVDADDLNVFEQIASSFTFGPKAPTSLQEAYGEDFRSALLSTSTMSGTLQQGSASLVGASSYEVPAGYRVPVAVHAGIVCGNLNAPLCAWRGSSHQGALERAIDISVGTGTSIKAVVASYTAAWGSDPGKGTYVTMEDRTSGYIAHYYHLSSIRYDTIWGQPVLQGTEIGLSGNTGASSGPHLHFHVQTTSGSSVGLSPMYGLTLNADYPNCGRADPADCPPKELDRELGWDCPCGQVN